MKTGLVFHEIYLWHDTGTWPLGYSPPGLGLEPHSHPESPESKRRLRNLLEVSGVLDHLIMLEAKPATVDQIQRFHTPAYVDRVRNMSEAGGGDAGELTPFGRGSYDIALLSAGGVIRAVEATLSGEVDNAYAFVRPPGHHAEADRGRGFCLFGNVAIAAKHARAELGVGRIATVDWDVHHGNGTQSAFYDDPDVLTISLHQNQLYPIDSGKVEERGAGRGLGYNLNIPLPPGSGEGAYIAAFERAVLPALRAYKPELIMVSSGFDACGFDPLARMMLHSGTYRTLTRMMKEAAAELCGGRLVLAHEGGYSAVYAPYCGLAVMEELCERRGSVGDPFQAAVSGWGEQGLQPHQERAIERAAANLAGIARK